MATNDDMPENFRDGEAPDENPVPASVPSRAGDADDAGGAPAQEKKPRGKPKAAKTAKARKAAETGKATVAAKAERVRREPKEKKESGRRQAKEMFDITSLPTEQQEKVMKGIERVNVLGRKTTENVFDLGETFDDIAVEVDNPSHWRDIIEVNTSYDVKTADNWAKVHRKFVSRRAEIISNNVTPTVLIALLPATDEQVDTVLASFNAGKRLKVREVNALVRAGLESVATTTAHGGAKGLRNLGSARLGRQQKTVTAALKAIRQMVASALEGAGSKRLEKGKLVKDVLPLARVAHAELTAMVCDIDPRSLSGSASLRHLPVADEAWAEVLALIETMTTAEDWPGATELKAWLSGKVMGLLAFALDGVESGAAADEAMVEITEAEAAAEGASTDATKVAVATDIVTTAVGASTDTPTGEEPTSDVAEGSTNVATLTSADRTGALKAMQPNPAAGNAASAPATIHAFRGKRPGAIMPGFLAAETPKPGGVSGKPDNAG
ncbi:hypothetical protein [Aurantimonas endophytica]|uniref:Uncharacterized protein n=1 Tax=Aurantimonas endophytica TaxID=1522175 RepID=A0A7W6MR30_9HYPH|nr:hypothetical protein [Aurantimonas endophytica]MBB4004594.1 hypothetical protein [Aurantimonas endophytica]MCO6405430.1 hypothetical protein [Aurantimonas endophytica]